MRAVTTSPEARDRTQVHRARTALTHQAPTPFALVRGDRSAPAKSSTSFLADHFLV